MDRVALLTYPANTFCANFVEIGYSARFIDALRVYFDDNNIKTITLKSYDGKHNFTLLDFYREQVQMHRDAEFELLIGSEPYGRIFF
jgi:hypothetical protein